MNRRALMLPGVLLLIALLFWAAYDQRSVSSEESESNLSISEFLAASPSDRYARVVPGQSLKFPDDHGAHPEFRQEWWYFTGILKDPDGRQFGYQLTFFRFASETNPALPEGAWNSGQTWMSHFAISDIKESRFLASEDFARGGLDLGGAEAEPFHVWTNGWSVRESASGCDGCFSVEMTAATADRSIDLRLSTTNPPTLHGDRGFSQKSRDGSVASYYYSFTDLLTEGYVTLGSARHSVTGQSWMDREWSSAILSDEQSGWDWFAIHLDNGRKLMMFQLRTRGGREDNYDYAILIDPDRPERNRQIKGLSFRPVSYWQRPGSDDRYPVEWKISGGGIDLNISALQKDQVVDLMFSYYEGAITVDGMIEGEVVNGEGYMELTGY